MSPETGAVVGAFATGLASSVGPCVAPRYLLAGASFSMASSRASAILFVAGTLSGYLLFALGGGILAMLRAGSHAIYLVIAIALLIAGAATLSRTDAGRCSFHAGAGRVRSAGAMFLLGASSSVMISPCCTPVAVALGMQAAAGGDVRTVLSALLAFGAGHAAPLIALISVASRFSGRFISGVRSEAASVVSGALLIAVGAIYGALA